MQIRYATSADRTAWDDYVLDHPKGSVFHMTHWQQAVTESFGHSSFHLMAVADQTGSEDRNKVLGVLPLFQIKSRLFGNYLVSVPFAELGGPLANDEKVAAALLAEAVAIAKRIECDYLELKNQEPIPGLPTKDLYFNFNREIFPEVEDNLLAVPRKSRAAVRKGINSGLTMETGNHLFDEFYEIMARTYHNHGTPIFPRRYFRNIVRFFGEQAEIMVVRNPEGQAIAAVQSFFFRDRVMPYFAGSLVQYRTLCPNDFMYWKLMESGCRRGFKVFDFGRSKVGTGSYKFKKNWGFEPRPLAYQYHLVRAGELPNLSPANPKYRKKIELWRKMPFALTKIIGPPLAKYLA